MKTKLPNFLIVGAAKSGTTSIHHYLKQHPNIYMPSKIKETFFLVEPKNILGMGPGDSGKRIVYNFKDYKELYEDVILSKHIAIGEDCVAYLCYYKESISNIKKYLKNPKIIIILRNPIQRAFSNYLHHVRDGIEQLSFKKALENERKRNEQGWWWGYRFTYTGFYYKQVKAYLNDFNQVKIYLYDDLKKDILGLVKDIYEFLEVDSSFTPDVSIKYNVTGIHKNKIIHNFLFKPNLLKNVIKYLFEGLIPDEKRKKIYTKIKSNLEKPQIKPETREQLKNLYREDILKLQDLIKRDLSKWLD